MDECKITRELITWLCKKVGEKIEDNGYFSHYSAKVFYLLEHSCCYEGDIYSIHYVIFRDLLQRARQGIDRTEFAIDVIYSGIDSTILCSYWNEESMSVRVEEFPIDSIIPERVYRITPEEQALIDVFYFIMEKESE